MTTTITKRAIPAPQGDLKPSVQALYSSVNELSGAIGSAMQRAVRVCELVDAGILQLQPNGQLGRSETVDDIGTIAISDVTGLTTALNARVLKAGDTMTGTLTNTASVGFDYQRTNGRMLIRDNGSGFPTLDFVNPANSAFAQARFTAVGYTFATSGGPFDITNGGGLRVFAAGQLKLYDANNDTPFEVGIGYTGGLDRHGYIWNRNNANIYFGTNNTPRGVILADGRLEWNHNVNVSGTINSDTRAITGLQSNVGYQIVWNVVQAGQGRTEFVNNNAGGSGGYTFYDRANTGVGLGIALAAILPGGIVVAQPTASTPTNWATFGLRAAGSFGGGLAVVDGGLVGGVWMSTGPDRMILGMNNGAGGAGMTGLLTVQPGNPTRLLQVEGGIFSTGGSATIHWRNRSGTQEWALYCNSNITRMWNGSTDIMTVDSSGNFAANNWTATSDERLKANIRQAPLNSELAHLPLIDWNWINSGQLGRGVSAQSVQKVAPAYVYAHPETGMLSVDKAGLALEMAMLALAHLRGDRHAVPL